MDTKFSFTLAPSKGPPTTYSGTFTEMSDAAADDLLRDIRAALNKAYGKDITLTPRDPPPGMTRVEK